MKNNAEALLSPLAIREGAHFILERTQAGKGFFTFHPERLDRVVDFVLEVIRKNYPTLEIPFHSRWGHFRVGGIDRTKFLDTRLVALDRQERARVKLDLVIPSVLLDAGAGASWKYKEDASTYSRSEGLGVASFHLFMSGILSTSRKDLRADASGLKAVTVADIEKYFQVTAQNPLVGVEGRVSLLNGLGRALENSTIFRDGRPGNILDYLEGRYGKSIPATGILRAVLDGLGPIWPGRIILDGVNLGDVWKHEASGELIAFHKLSQWMTYSLIEPIVEAGFQVTGVNELTGLAEYRNGGLILDSELVTLKDQSHAAVGWAPGSDLIIEWRALTIALLDPIGEKIRAILGKSPEEFPLAKVLEGGTWWAGRALANKKRQNGDPPLKIESDGTVF